MSLWLGAGLIAAWLVVLVAIVRLHLPPVLAKADVGVAALLWAAHVLHVTLHNRALDRLPVLSAHPREAGDLRPEPRAGGRTGGGRSPPPRG